MKHSSRRFHPSAALLEEIDEITSNLTAIIGDFSAEYHVPDEPDDIVDALVWLGKACAIGHSVSMRPVPPPQEVFDGLNRIALVMGLFERDLDADHVEAAVDVMLDTIQASAAARESYSDYFGEFRERFDGPSAKIVNAELEQALELRRNVEYAKIALQEMRRLDEAPDLKGRLIRYDEAFGVTTQLAAIKAKPHTNGAAE
ncbi:MAG: hypothetical protein ABIH86_04835 [Planctomycetota bacterium]